MIIPISDGSHTFECSHYYSGVKSDIPEHEIVSPSCKIEPIGVILPSAPAKVGAER